MSKHIRAQRSQHPNANLPIFNSAYHHLRKEETGRVFAERGLPRKAKKKNKKLIREIVGWSTTDRIPQLPGENTIRGFNNMHTAADTWTKHSKVNK